VLRCFLLLGRLLRGAFFSVICVRGVSQCVLQSQHQHLTLPCLNRSQTLPTPPQPPSPPSKPPSSSTVFHHPPPNPPNQSQNRAVANLFKGPNRIDAIGGVIDRLESGDLKLRVRALETERALTRVQVRCAVVMGGGGLWGWSLARGGARVVCVNDPQHPAKSLVTQNLTKLQPNRPSTNKQTTTPNRPGSASSAARWSPRRWSTSARCCLYPP